MKIFMRFKCYHLQYKLGSHTIMFHQQTRQEKKKRKCNQATIAQTMNQDSFYLVLPMASCGSTSLLYTQLLPSATWEQYLMLWDLLHTLTKQKDSLVQQCKWPFTNYQSYYKTEIIQLFPPFVPAPKRSHSVMSYMSRTSFSFKCKELLNSFFYPWYIILQSVRNWRPLTAPHKQHCAVDVCLSSELATRWLFF